MMNDLGTFKPPEVVNKRSGLVASGACPLGSIRPFPRFLSASSQFPKKVRRRDVADQGDGTPAPALPGGEFLKQNPQEPLAICCPVLVVIRGDLRREHLLDRVLRRDLLPHAISHHDEHVVVRLESRAIRELGSASNFIVSALV